MAALIVLVTVLVVLDLAALRWEIESRAWDGADWDWRPDRPLIGGRVRKTTLKAG